MQRKERFSQPGKRDLGCIKTSVSKLQLSSCTHGSVCRTAFSRKWGTSRVGLWYSQMYIETWTHIQKRSAERAKLKLKKSGLSSIAGPPGSPHEWLLTNPGNMFATTLCSPTAMFLLLSHSFYGNKICSNTRPSAVQNSFLKMYIHKCMRGFLCSWYQKRSGYVHYSFFTADEGLGRRVWLLKELLWQAAVWLKWSPYFMGQLVIADNLRLCRCICGIVQDHFPIVYGRVRARFHVASMRTSRMSCTFQIWRMRSGVKWRQRSGV